MLYTQSLSKSHRPNNVLLCSIETNHIENTPSDTAYCRLWGFFCCLSSSDAVTMMLYKQGPSCKKGSKNPPTQRQM